MFLKVILVAAVIFCSASWLPLVQWILNSFDLFVLPQLFHSVPASPVLGALPAGLCLPSLSVLYTESTLNCPSRALILSRICSKPVSCSPFSIGLYRTLVITLLLSLLPPSICAVVYFIFIFKWTHFLNLSVFWKGTLSLSKWKTSTIYHNRSSIWKHMHWKQNKACFPC